MLGPGVFRFLLAFIVLLEHAKAPLQLGIVAVYIFFILSGFWITRVYQSRYGRFDNGSILFVVARLWRLYPAFIIATTATAYFSNQGISAIGLENFSLFAGNGHAKFMQVGWSLVVETQFYLVAPLFVDSIFSRDRAIYVALLVVSASVYYWWAGYLGLPSYGHLFLAGALAASFRWQPSSFCALGTALMGVISLAILQFGFDAAALASNPDAHFNVLRCYAAISLLFAPLAIYTASNKSGIVDNFFGDMSYTLYLAHWPVANNAGGILYIDLDISIMERTVLFSLIAALILYIVERPFIYYRTFFLKLVDRISLIASLPRNRSGRNLI